MAIPSLVYEDDTTPSRIQVAETQLVEAINLFIAEKFLCAITLSGAAEEILGKLVEQKQGPAVINESVGKV